MGKKRHGTPMEKTPWDDLGHSPPASMKIWLISKTAQFHLNTLDINWNIMDEIISGEKYGY
jgi:hypothetical protein